MDYRSSRHAAPAQAAPAEAPAAAPAEKPAERSSSRGTKHKGSGGRKLPLKLIGIIAAVVVVLAAAWYFMSGNVASSIDGGKMQAVFFTNGQVYFGKLKVVNSDYMKLTNIYYLQANTTDNADNPQKTGSGSDVQLIKLGDEIHGPEDEMVFNKDQVLFFENLKPDGNVSKTIAEDQKN